MNSPLPHKWATRYPAFLFAALLALLTLATQLPAAPGPPPHPAPPAQELDDVRETLRVLMIVSMKRALDLTPEQEQAVVPKIQQVFDERERFAREHQETLRRMQVQLMEESVPEQEFRNVVVRLDQLEHQHRELETRLRGEIDRSLSARQQAELRLFVPRFRRQMQVRIDQARRLQEQKYRRPATITPPLPDEDDSPDDDEEF